MGADSSEGQKRAKFVPANLDVAPAAGWSPETIAEFTYDFADGSRARGILGHGASGLYLQTISVDSPPGGRVTTKMLREVPLTDILAAVQRTDFIQARIYSSHQEQQQASESKKPGRTPLSDDLMREVALGYLDQTAPGMGRGAVKRLAERMGVDQKTMSRYVFRARQTGWLGPAIHGREGSEPGPKLIAESGRRDHRQRGVGGHPRRQSVKADEPGDAKEE